MRHLIPLFFIILLGIAAHSNPIVESDAYISEIYFDENDNWTIEIFCYYINEDNNDFIFHTSEGTADISFYAGNSEIILITADDLSTPLTINRDGDFIYLTQFDDYYLLCDTVSFGNSPGATVNAPLIGESLVNVIVVDYGFAFNNICWLVIDTAPSLGYISEPVKQSFSGYLRDNTGTAIPNVEINYGAIGDLPKIWTDENGYFESNSMFCKNYTVKIGEDIILEDPLTIYFDNPVYREYDYNGPGKIQAEGYCYLQNASSHEGTKNCPEWIIDSTVTDSEGHFNIELDIGYYSIIYMHENYYPEYSFDDNNMFVNNNLYGITLNPGFVNVILGNNQNGIWSSNYPFWILGNVIIDDDDTLLISEGCEIEIKDKFIFDVKGRLIINGTEGDSVYFHKIAEVYFPYEYSIAFNGTNSNNSLINYAVFNGSGAGLKFDNASVILKNSRFYYNFISIGTFGNSKPLIDSTLFTKGRIKCYGNSIPTISHSVFSGNYSSIVSADSSGFNLFNNLFLETGHPVSIYTDSVICSNNLFYNCTSPVSIYEDRNPVIDNNIFVGNHNALAFINCYANQTRVRYNCFWNNEGDFTSSFGSLPPFIGELSQLNYNNDSCDFYYNIFVYPAFTDTLNNDFHLTELSPCIDAGNPESSFDPDLTIADIGPYYFYHITSINDNYADNLEFFRVFPNPAGSDINIAYKLKPDTKAVDVRLKVFDLNGSEIISEGFHGQTMLSLRLSNNNISYGTYFFVLELENKTVAIEKVIVK